MKILPLLAVLALAGCAGGSPGATTGGTEIGPGADRACFERFDLPNGGRIDWSWRFRDPDTSVRFPDRVLFRIYLVPDDRLDRDAVAAIRRGEIPAVRTLSVRASEQREAAGFELVRRPGAVVFEWLNDNPSAPVGVRWSVSVREGN